MTPNEITTLIASNLDKELDMPFKLQLMERVKYWRSRLLVNTVNKDPFQRRFFKQTLYLTMEPSSKIRCASLVNIPVSATQVAVPQEVIAGSVQFDYVGGADGSSPFQQLQAGTELYLSSGKFYPLCGHYEFINRFIVTDKERLPLIRIDAIFDDPQLIQQLSAACTGQTCDTWNQEFPVNNQIMQLIVQSILQVDYNRAEREDTPQIEVNNTK
ncbi:MAG: hypothetical protein HYU71_06340 [Bacteroidetes bacterium]|nr:hypothetical protein [Bacteroidota bacterium]